MPSKRLHPKRCICLPGLYFGPGEPFSSRPMAERAYTLLLGADFATSNRDVDELQERATRVLTAILSLCIARVPTILSLQHPTLGWQIVAADVAEQYGGTLTPADAEELVRVFAGVRSEHLAGLNSNSGPDSTPSELATLADQWLDATRHDDRAPAAEPTSLASWPAPLENLLADVQLHESPAPIAAPTATTTPPWPPRITPPPTRTS